MRERRCATYRELFHWSVSQFTEFWHHLAQRLQIRFTHPYHAVADISDLREPRWFPGGRLNIAESCFNAPRDAVAMVYQAEGGPRESVSYGELRALANRVANGLRDAGYRPGDAIALDLPMTAESVAIYLGIIFAGCTAVGHCRQLRRGGDRRAPADHARQSDLHPGTGSSATASCCPCTPRWWRRTRHRQSCWHKGPARRR